jgi:hypothetical protein
LTIGHVSQTWLRDYRATSERKEHPVSLKRHAAKRDVNETQIVRALEKIGCLVLKLDSIDLLVWRQSEGRLYLLEVKTKSSRSRLTATQQDLLERGWPMTVVTTPQEAIDAVTASSTRCAARDCEKVFVRSGRQKFCSEPCSQRTRSKAKYDRDPEAAREKAKVRYRRMAEKKLRAKGKVGERKKD